MTDTSTESLGWSYPTSKPGQHNDRWTLTYPRGPLETIEYRSAIDDYLETEVHPYIPDAWPDSDKTKIGYEIPLTRHFYSYTPPRVLAEIDAELKALEVEIQELVAEVTN